MIYRKAPPHPPRLLLRIAAARAGALLGAACSSHPVEGSIGYQPDSGEDGAPVGGGVVANPEAGEPDVLNGSIAYPDAAYDDVVNGVVANPDAGQPDVINGVVPYPDASADH